MARNSSCLGTGCGCTTAIIAFFFFGALTHRSAMPGLLIAFSLSMLAGWFVYTMFTFENSEENASGTTNPPSPHQDLPDWTCACCGNKNRSDKDNCENCDWPRVPDQE